MLKFIIIKKENVIHHPNEFGCPLTFLYRTSVKFYGQSTFTMAKYLSLAIAEAIVLAPSFFLLYLSETNSAYAKLFNISHTPIHDMS